MNMVFVLDTDKNPLSMCRPARARLLLKEGKAAVYRRFPFTIILNKSLPDAVVREVSVKVDPGSKHTGLVIVDNKDNRVNFAAELEHRGQVIKNSLQARSALRRGRRNRKTRYRAARYLNRKKCKGWLPPSLEHRVLTTMTWVNRFRKYANVTEIAVERVKFDMQKMQDDSISGLEYQQGTLQGYEIREYLLEKYNRACIYCDVTNLPLQVEHIHPKSKGGSNRISNLTLACEACNKAKDNLDIEVFLSKKPELLKSIKSKLKQPLRDAAAVNATRNRLFQELLKTGLPVEVGTGAQTKYNRIGLNLPKKHWVDAACVGESGASVRVDTEMKHLLIKCRGHGHRRMCVTDKYGFPRQHRTNKKIYFGFKTGDIVKAVVTKGKYAGTHKGRVMCRAIGSFDISTSTGKVTVSYKNCKVLHRIDGYSYT